MIRRVRRGVAALLATLALAGTPVVPATAVAPLTGDVLTLLGDGAWFGGRETIAETAAGPFPAGVRAAGGGVDLVYAVGDGPVGVRLDVQAPVDSPRLSVRRYEVNRHDSDADVHLTVGLPGQRCDLGTVGPSVGFVDVLDLARGADGRLSRLALDYAVVCSSTDPPVRGSLRWNSGVPWVHTAVTSFAAPDSGAGVTRRGTVTLTNAGAVAQTFGPSTWQQRAGDGPAQVPVVIERDGCAGVRVAPGSTCSVEVSVTSDGVRGAHGHVRTPDGTLRGAALSPVTMTAVATPPAPGLHAESERGAVRLWALPYHPTYRVLRAAPGAPEVEIARDVALPWSDTTGIGGVTYTYRVVPVAGGADGPASAPLRIGALPRPVGERGTFVTADPVRLLDTRDGTGARVGRLGPGQTLLLDPAASGSLPRSGVSAVLLNVTGTDASAATHVRVWPAGDPRPGTSSVNLVPGQSRPNQVVVPLGEDGRIALYNNTGSTHLVVDLQGFYSDVDGPQGGGYHAGYPRRVLDTRTGHGPLGASQEIWVPVAPVDLDTGRMAAVEVNLTVTEPTADGHLTAWAGGTEVPVVSNANFAPEQTVANHAVVPVSVGPDGRPGIMVRNSAGRTHLVVDVLGWYDGDAQDDGLRYAPSPTRRVVDTRASAQRRPVDPRGWASVPHGTLPTGVAHVVNVTATEGVAGGHLTAWDGISFDGEPPRTSTVNFARGEDSPNLTTVASSVHLSRLVGLDLGFPFTGAGVVVSAGTSSVHVVVDHVGYYY